MEFIIPAIAGSVIGPTQTILLREYADKPMAIAYLKAPTTVAPPLLVKQLQGFGAPSSLISIISGAIALGLGLYSTSAAKKGTPKIFKRFNEQLAVITYGASALLTGIESGIWPTDEIANVIAVDPANPLVGAKSSGRAGRMTLGASPTAAGVALPPITRTPNQNILARLAA